MTEVPEPARAQERVRQMAEGLLVLLAVLKGQTLLARLMAAVENPQVAGILLLVEVAEILQAVVGILQAT